MRAALETIAQRDVDLIVLNRASPILAFQAAKTGVMIMCRDRRALSQLLVKLITEYAGFKITRHQIEEVVIKRRML